MFSLMMAHRPPSVNRYSSTRSSFSSNRSGFESGYARLTQPLGQALSPPHSHRAGSSTARANTELLPAFPRSHPFKIVDFPSRFR